MRLESNLWDNVLRTIKTKLPRDSFVTWFQPIQLKGIDNVGRTIRLLAPNSVVRDWVKVNYSNLIDQSISEFSSVGYSIDWIEPEENPKSFLDTLNPKRLLTRHVNVQGTREVDPARLQTWYMRLVASFGVILSVLCTIQFPRESLNVRFAALFVITVLVGSRISVKIPNAQGQVAVSDTFIFLAILLFGTEAAVLLAAAEAVCSSLRFAKQLRVILFNAGVMSVSTFLTSSFLHNLFPSNILREGYSPSFIIAVCLMAMMQYFLNSGFIAISPALRNSESLWKIWRREYLWTSLTYFVGASGAAIVTRLSGTFGIYAFVVTAPIVVIIYFTYRTYLTNVETAAARAEQAKIHVGELNRYIAEQKRISKALTESEEHFRNAFDYAAIGMALVSPGGKWLRVNRSLCDILGYSESVLLTSDFQAITHAEDLAQDLVQISRVLAAETLSYQVEKRYIHKLGNEVWVSSSASLVRDAHGQPLHLIFQIQDITKRKQAEAAIQRLSVVDELTGLYNRRGFLVFSEQYSNTLLSANKGLAIIYADLDGLKQINDCRGHKEGDQAIIKSAELLKETFPVPSIVGRWGGDEFTILVATKPQETVGDMVARLERKFESYNAKKLSSYPLSLSVGIAQLYPNEKRSLEDLMVLADAAMYEHKRMKKAQIHSSETEVSKSAV